MMIGTPCLSIIIHQSSIINKHFPHLHRYAYTMESDSCPYPALPPPVPIRLITSPPHPCAYLPDRLATTRAFYVDRLPGRVYHRFMDASFRRSGKVIYQPICAGCRACMPIRVLVDSFAANKSQRRSLKRNEDLKLKIDLPAGHR